MDINAWSHIDAVYYINLDHRTDRLVQIESEFDKVCLPFSKRIRISAEFTPECGALGCCLSHVKALELFLDSGNGVCIVIEDDFQFTCDALHVNYMISSVFQRNIPFDLIMLAGNVGMGQASNIDILTKVTDGQTTSGYMITRDFAFALLDLWRKTAVLIKMNMYGTGSHHYLLACDRTWKKLQPRANWYIFNPRLGTQRESYSDIEQRMTNYGC